MNTRWAYVPSYDEETSGRSWQCRVLVVTVLSGALLAVLIRGWRRER